MKVKALIASLGLAVVAPFAHADTAQLELLPRIGGAETTQYVASKVTTDSDESSKFFYAHTGGVAPL